MNRTPFGVTASGQTAELLTLRRGALSCTLLTYGAALQSLLVPDRDGCLRDVVLGYDTLDEYERQDGYLGAVVGRCANRIARGRFTLNGSAYSLAVNNGKNHLHGGPTGFSTQIWQVAELTEDTAVLTLDSPDGHEGYPARLQATVTYQLTETGLSIRYQAESNGDTLCNLTNHAYFNLAGHAGSLVLDHELQLFASRYTPTDAGSIPTGELAPVTGTPMDFTAPMPIGARIESDFEQLKLAGGYDHNFVLDEAGPALHPAAELACSESGIRMAVSTTLPGIQVYSANYLDDGRQGKGGVQYQRRQGLCLETQFFPDSVNQPTFPSSALLRAGERFDHTTIFAFSC